MKILIVDDNELMRRTIRSVIASYADSVYECADGLEAIALYAEHRPDWVLMDIRMKRIDGIEATKRIKASFPDAKIAIVTEYNDPKLEEVAYRAGACRYLLKRRLIDVGEILSADEA